MLKCHSVSTGDLIPVTIDGQMPSGREQRRRRWGAPRAMLLAGAPLAAPADASTEATVLASGVTANWMARTRGGGWRARNGPRRACAGWAVKRHFGHSPSRTASFAMKNRVPEVSLRRWRVLLVAARSSPCGAARGKAQVTDSGQSKRRILVARCDHYVCQRTRTSGVSLR